MVGGEGRLVSMGCIWTPETEFTQRTLRSQRTDRIVGTCGMMRARKGAMDTKQRLHDLVEQLPAAELDTAVILAL